MTGQHLYTLKELAKELGVGESTVRYWRDTFSEFIPTITQGRRKYYRSDALDTFRVIMVLSHSRSYNAAQIRDELSLHAPIEGRYEKAQRSDGAAQNQRSYEEQPPALGDQVSVREFVREVFEGVQGIIQEQNRRMESLEAENRELRERLTKLEEQGQQQIAVPQQDRSEIAAPQQSREKVVAYIAQLRKEGYSYRGIAIRLTEEGIQGLRGGRWDGKTVFRLLRKEGIE